MNEPTKAIQFLIDTAEPYSKAKATRIFLEGFLKSRKAQLMSQVGTEVLGKQETFAMPMPITLKYLKESGKLWRGKSVFATSWLRHKPALRCGAQSNTLPAWK
jgi:hypothetical protein